MSRRQEAGVSPEERRRARETAHSMYEGRGINKDEIARVIGAESKYERLVCMYYLQLFDFKAQDIVSAIRRFLSHFALNAEAQEIDRIMYSFAERYCEQNPTEYSVDAIHALAMAILLLNTDLHTPNNTRRMRQDQFIYNLAALNDGADFPRQLLQDIYNSIKAEQLVPVATHDKTAASHGAQQDNAGRPSFSVLRGRPSRVLDAFFLGEPIEPPTLEEIIQQKDTFDAFQARTSFRHRAWRTLHAAICGRYLIFHKSSFQPRSIQDYGHNVYDVVLLYHAFCRRALEYTKRDHVFELTTATGRRMLFTVPCVSTNAVS
ncbi:hypothetical protein PTSG_07714 [Salpingoeca rosetta]|uniref:SEC7 domain-containing protein n=1 Tax=Salpingoeca rosetta (strain ATCC 50818 / BSB-021) TaxID=946362 RepID=F2UHJ8_SALR5|nr:uncharacterized protein PTSG_07714 [Salpingoeca rosetta]EGD76597.1 hypothetical protein PTSG_07714 [Salpingoeca rosetta]|eukprot:XP_004991511.1 hypothetical protein PTSG_07714 [Salpingoeca rosetta]